MKILHTVESYYPARHGMAEVVKQISENLVKKGHEVVVATGFDENREEKKVNGVKIVEFDVSGNFIRGIKGEAKRYQEYILDSEYEVITNFAAQQWATDLVFPILPKIKALKIFVPTGFSGLYWDEYKDYFCQMSEWMKKYDANIFTSDKYQDAIYAKKHGISSTIITNGASKNEFDELIDVDIRREFDIPDDYLLVLNVGSHTGLKGHLSAINIFEAARVKKVAFLIIANEGGGGCYKECKRMESYFRYFKNRIFTKKHLKILDIDRRSTIAAYQQSDIFLFTSEIECSPIVLFESMASKTPILTNNVGNSAEILEWSKSGILLPTNFTDSRRSIVDVNIGAEILKSFCENSELRKSFAKEGYNSWNKYFTWERIAGKYEGLYQDLFLTK